MSPSASHLALHDKELSFLKVSRLHNEDAELAFLSSTSGRRRPSAHCSGNANRTPMPGSLCSGASVCKTSYGVDVSLTMIFPDAAADRSEANGQLHGHIVTRREALWLAHGVLEWQQVAAVLGEE